jgi:DEAD/DEAH box helicase domain-containing protein
VWEELLDLGRPPNEERLAWSTDVPARPGRTAPIPGALHPALHAALARQGIEALWTHQAEAVERALGSRHVAVTTGTASGKSLAYHLPVLDRILREPASRVLYLAPTKALAQDQGRALAAFGLGRAVRFATYDGDTPASARLLARRTANILLTNPDMIHAGVCPNHERWGDVLQNLSHIVVDEAHVYRGVFGSHVAHVLRRLRRLAALHGTAPQLLLASATIANPGEAFGSLTGLPIDVIEEDGSPAAERTVAFWNPTLLDPSTGQRASSIAEASALFVELVARGHRAIVFARSRNGVELVQKIARELLLLRAPELADRIAAYRAGYTPADRRELERRLTTGELVGVVATSALELGIDIGALDAAVVIGFPGTIASLRQRFGRAGRRGRPALAVLVASEDALDQHLAHAPQRLLGRPVEAAILDPANPEIRSAHLACAAHESPITERDDAILGPGTYEQAAAETWTRPLARTPRGIAWIGPDSPATGVGLRSASASTVAIVDETSGELLGTSDSSRAPRSLHVGAIHLHRGRSYAVSALDLEEGLALVEPFSGDWYTQARVETEIALAEEPEASTRLGDGLVLHYGAVEVAEQVTGYQRKRLPGHEVLDTRALELPEARYTTRGFWLRVPDELLAGIPSTALLGSLHAAEHALISVLPLVAMCDRWDVGGLSTDFHPDTGGPTIVIHEAHPGGVGITRRSFEAFAILSGDAALVVRDCPCDSGCPSCVQSPKCGNLNEPLSKRGALMLLAGFERATTP